MTADESIDAVADALTRHLTEDDRWSVARRVRWDGDPANPNMAFEWGVVVFPTDAPVEITPDGCRLAPEVDPIFLFDLVSDNWEREYYDKPDVIYCHPDCEWVVFDPTGERMRPTPMALRWQGATHREVSPVIDDVYFSNLGFRLQVSGEGVSLRPCGSPHLEEKRVTLREELAVTSAEFAASRRKLDGLNAALVAVERELGVPDRPQ